MSESGRPRRGTYDRSISDVARPGGHGSCPQGCTHPVAGEDTLDLRERTEPIEPPNVFEHMGETVVQTRRVEQYLQCCVCGWVVDV